jgi:hypothetical protein
MNLQRHHSRRQPSRPCTRRLWLPGDLLCSRIIRILPPLVGQIAVGMLVWGPHGLGLVWMDDDAAVF